jgi:hypothetical protein
VFGSGALVWYLAAHPATSGLPLWPAYAFAAVALIGLYCVFAPLIGLPPWRRNRRMKMAEKDEQGEQTVHGDRNIINPSGGTNVTGDVHITAPQPQVRPEQRFANQKQGDKYVTQALLHLDAPYAATKLQVEVRGSSIERVEMHPEPNGPMFNTSQSVDPGPTYAVWEVGSPLRDTYVVTVHSSRPDALNMNVVLVA